MWPGYFADPANAPECPPDLRISLACNGMTMGSVMENLSGGFAAKLNSVTVPAVFLLGERSPIPVRHGQQAAALLPNATARVTCSGTRFLGAWPRRWRASHSSRAPRRPAAARTPGRGRGVDLSPDAAQPGAGHAGTGVAPVRSG
jgi:hypothetical protein